MGTHFIIFNMKELLSELNVNVSSYPGAAAEACVKYLVSKNDSKLEREAKTELDEVFGGEVNYKEVCNWTFS